MRKHAIHTPFRTAAYALLAALAVSGCDLTTALLPAPVITADAGGNLTVPAEEPATIRGSGSHERGETDLSYAWYLIRVPAAVTQVMMADVNRPNLTFIPPRPGTYVFALVVGDGTYESRPDTVEVTAVP